MGNTYYIVAIELSSSKISGAVGIETTEGMRILATASTPVDGFISKGIVRNVDKTSETINNIVNILENDLRKATQKDITIKKAYITFAGLSVHSIKSKVSRDFGKYIKITQEVIDDMECENQDTFLAPDGYKRLQVDPQEYRLEGNIDYNPIGAPTQSIECNYLNIVMKEQFYTQLCDSFAQAGIEIEDDFCAAHFDADILLSKDLRRNGCALVNIGAETTTISIYNNDKPKMLTVLPLGGNNITRDLTAELVSFAQAEEIKFTQGYKGTGNNGSIDSETVNNVIYARMGEILKNVRYQIEESGERVNHIVFTGGGSKLKNLKMLLEEFLPNFSTEIKPEPQFNLLSESGVNVNGVITTALYGLLKQGKANCCEDVQFTAAQQAAQQNGVFFFHDEVERPTVADKPENIEKVETKTTEEETKPEQPKPEKVNSKEPKEPKEPKGPKRPFFGPLFDFAKTFVNNATSEDETEDDDTTTEQ